MPLFRRPRLTISPHETVVLYPSYAYRNPELNWTIVVQGCVYHSRITWLRRKPVLAVIRRYMRVGQEGDTYFKQRMRQFLAHVASGRQVSLQLGDQQTTLGPTEQAGLLRGEWTIPAATVAVVSQPDSTYGQAWVEYRCTLPAADTRTFQGRAQLIDPAGLSIISDVDDTLKHSNVPNRRDLFHNTFVRDFVPIDGMPQLYRDCASVGVAFHYVSGSPWQLYEPLSEFWLHQGYPAGSFHLKRFRLRESARKLRSMSPQQAHKQAAIEPILQAFPRRQFVLIGDSGEQDPEIYAHFLRTRPDQVRQVFIRAVRGLSVDQPRLAETFRDLPPDRWSLYESSETIRPQLLQMATDARKLAITTPELL
ncbi:DUF2183 domain-containing protein [bacterium]|nr:DUF2183 domain-containing protein [bacterium]